MTAYLAQDFRCPRCLFLMERLDINAGRAFFFCKNQACPEYHKLGSYPLQEVHLQPEEMNG